MGEITRQKTKDGVDFYGLPHSALADVFWEHGKEYGERIQAYEDFIYDYAASGVANGLEAVCRAIGETGKRVLDRLYNADKFYMLIFYQHILLLEWFFLFS